MMFYKENQFKDTPLGKIPKEWECRSLNDVVASCENGVWGDEPSVNENSYPVIRSTEITHDGRIDLSSVAYRKISEEMVERYALKNGDILVVGSSGSAHLIGRTALFLSSDDRKYLFSNFMIRIRPRNINPHFLYYFLNSNEYFAFLKKLQQTSTGLRNLRRKEFLKLNLPFPPFSEQEAIVGVLGVVDSVVGLVDRVILKTERLKKGLMQTLLTRGIGHKEYKQTPIGTTPKTWQIVKLGDVLELCQYGLSVRFGETGKYRILKMDDIVDGVAIPDNAKFVDLD
ncbi:MAG: restriction endonuclease subunit S, partial [Candidatus Bathyarchaeia archaeon]